MKKIIQNIYLIIPLILSFHSHKAICENKKAENNFSAFYSFYTVNDSIPKAAYDKALKLFKSKKYSKALNIALPIPEKCKNNQLKVLANLLIGKIFESSNNHNKAILYFKESLKLLSLKKDRIESSTKSLDFNSDVIAAEVFLKLGSEYQNLSQIDSAKHYFNKLAFLNSLNSKVLNYKGTSFTNLSAIYFYFEKKDLKKAKHFAKKAIEIHKSQGDTITLAADYTNLGSIYMEEGNLNESKKTYFKALNLIKNKKTSKAIKYQEILYDNIGWVLYNQKDYISYNYLNKSIEIGDSLRNIELTKAIEEIELKHNIENVKQSEELKRAKIQSEKEASQKNTWIVGVFGLAAILLLFFIANYYKLRQSSLKLELSKKELDQQKKLEKLKSDSQTKILNATLDGKESERKQITETLHDNISTLLSSANLHLQASNKQYNDDIPIEIKKTQEIILDASQQIRNLSHTLVSSVLLKFGLEYAIKEITEKYSNSLLNINASFRNIHRYPQELEIKTYNIIQELVNNIIKHSKATNASVSLTGEDQKLYINIKDNGDGFDVNGVAIKNGIGINQINARIQVMQGSFIINSKEKKGTEIEIIIPITLRAKTTYA